jgi:SAM-dependent methyltransferase
MLKMHLSQNHDMASRRDELIEKQVQWIQKEILKNNHSRILDVGCGPGLYIKKLTGLGHECTGIDFSPASIEYARQNCQEASFILDDIRNAHYGETFDVAMLLFGEINVFSPKECKLILKKMHDCLKPGGRVLIEAHLFDTITKMGKAQKSWFRSGNNHSNRSHWFDNVMNDCLFSSNPHIVLIENNWLEEEKVALSNFWVLEDDKEVSHYVSTSQAYTNQDYITLLKEASLNNITLHGDFGSELTNTSNYQVISASTISLCKSP